MPVPVVVLASAPAPVLPVPVVVLASDPAPALPVPDAVSASAPVPFFLVSALREFSSRWQVTAYGIPRRALVA